MRCADITFKGRLRNAGVDRNTCRQDGISYRNEDTVVDRAVNKYPKNLRDVIKSESIPDTKAQSLSPEGQESRVQLDAWTSEV